MENLNPDLEIRYTLDGSKPSKGSELYTGPFMLTSGEVRVIAFDHDQAGGETSDRFGILKKGWSLKDVSSEETKYRGIMAFDGDPATYWRSNDKDGHPHFISVDLGATYNLTEFAYTLQTMDKNGMIEKGLVLISKNGKIWKEFETFEFGNLINDPTRRYWKFNSSVKTRYIRIQSERGAGDSNITAIAELDLFEP
jgi:alpha-L-fucosidase